jgi:hypothetical protein
MERQVEEFSGNVDNIQLLVVDFLGDESVCEHEDCNCGMDLPWAVIAEVATDEYPVDEDDDDEEETVSEVISRACSVEAALMSAREFQEECDEKWSILLTDAASYVFKLEAAFSVAAKSGNFNWEDLNNLDSDDPIHPPGDPEMN